MIPVTRCLPPPGFRALVTVLVFIVAMSGPEPRAEVVLYEAEVAWSDQDGADRAGAFRQALRQVLVKVTGMRRLAEEARIEPLIENAQGLVQQYQLRKVEVRHGEATVPEPRLWARFDEAAVDRLVRDAGLPVWSRIRPPVLVWVAAEREGPEGTPRVAGSEGAEGLAEILRNAADSRGVSLVLPLLDLEDQVLAGPPELWMEAEERIRAASERYRPGGILIGRIGHDVVWEARWSLLLPGTAQRWKTEGDLFDLVVDEGVQEAIDALAAHYANAAPEAEGAAILVSVSGVHDFMGYGRTMRYLESLDEVESVDVLAVFSGRLRLGLKLRTGVAGLRGLIALGSTLAEDAGDVDGALALRLLP